MRLIKNVGSSYLYKTGVTTYEIHSNDDIINAISLIGINLKQPRKHYKKSKNKKCTMTKPLKTWCFPCFSLFLRVFVYFLFFLFFLEKERKIHMFCK